MTGDLIVVEQLGIAPVSVYSPQVFGY